MKTHPMMSVNAAASALERDRGTLVRALKYVKPDGHAGTGKKRSLRWKLRTIVDALAEHEAKQRPVQNNAQNNAQNNDKNDALQLLNEFEATFERFDAGCKKLAAEPDLAKRRVLNEKLGVMRIVGEVQRKFEVTDAAINEVTGQEADAMYEIVRDRVIIASMIGKTMDLLDYSLMTPEQEAVAERLGVTEMTDAEMEVALAARKPTAAAC
jgi:hypothetical protein